MAYEATQVLAEASFPLLSDTQNCACVRQQCTLKQTNENKSCMHEKRFPSTLRRPEARLCRRTVLSCLLTAAIVSQRRRRALAALLLHSSLFPWLCMESFFSPRAAAERSPLTGGPGRRRVNGEFTRLAISHLPKSPRIHCRLCLLPPSLLPFCSSPQRWHCRRFLWERRDLRWSESADVFPAPRQPHHHWRAETGRTKSVTTCLIIHGSFCHVRPLLFRCSPPHSTPRVQCDLICPASMLPATRCRMARHR